jgi:hypothetical protein
VVKKAVEVAVAVADEVLTPVVDAFQKLGSSATGAGKPTVYGRNETDKAVMTRTGRISDAAWSDPTVLVGDMTQNAAIGGNASDRCGPTNVLAGALLQGPSVAAKFLESEAGHAGSKLGADQKKGLNDIAARLRAHTATYEDLSMAQNLLYQSADTRIGLGQALDRAQAMADKGEAGDPLSTKDFNRLKTLYAKVPDLSAPELKEMGQLLTKALDREVTVKIEPDPRTGKGKQTFVHMAPGDNDWDQSGLDDGEILAHARAGGLKAQSVPFNAGAKDPAGAALAGLKPGESAVLRVAADSSAADPGHFVTVGRLKDGRPYVYNPDPAKGDATLVVGTAKDPQPADFTREVFKYSQRARPDLDDSNPAATVIHY